jgi:hypothetical protein
MILAAFFTSRHVSSNLVITLTIVPSITSVRSVIRLKLIPRAHSYTTSTIPKRPCRRNSFASADFSTTWYLICTSVMRSEMAMILSRPRSRAEVRFGSFSVFSWNTKAESSATISSGSKSARTFSRMSSVRTSSSPV